jgi:ribosomal protein L37AE/L43A
MTKCKHEKIVTWRFEDGYEPAGLWSCAHCNLKFAPMAETFAAGLERAAEIADAKAQAVRAANTHRGRVSMVVEQGCCWIDDVVTAIRAEKDSHE